MIILSLLIIPRAPMTFWRSTPQNKAETPIKTGGHLGSRYRLGYSSPIKVSTRKLRSSPIPNCFFRPTAWLFAISPRLAISRLQWTQRKKTKSAQRDRVRTDVGVESDERQDVIACKIGFFSWMNFLPGKWPADFGTPLRVFRGKTT